MSAVATILGLLLVVTFVSEFILIPLPQTMSDLELQHIILLENQLSKLQSTVLSESATTGLHLSIASPVTLGSTANPPFGAGASSTVSEEGAGARSVSHYTIASIVPAPPLWNNGSNCLTGGSGKCSSNGNLDTWNVTGQNNTTFTITVNGNSNSVEYNISANNDTINIDWTGGDTGFVLFIINGSNDVVNYNKGGSDTTSPLAQFLFYGLYDTFNFNPAGSHSSKGGMKLQVVFVGIVGRTCPGGNTSATDNVGTLSSGGSNLNMSVTWWNSVGYVSPPTKQTYPGGSGNNETIWWANNTGFVQCAFTKAYGTLYTTQHLGGLQVQVNDIYLPQAVVAYDDGAVVEGQAGGTTTMVSPPEFEYTLTPAGIVASITLVDLIGNFSAESGRQTAAITTSLATTQTSHLGGSNATLFLTSSYILNLTTQFPAAWSAFFAKIPKIVPGGTSCIPQGSIPAPYTCLAPPPGVYVTLEVPIVAVSITLKIVTAFVSIS
ncbi:MAG TPA: hypothetical protein VFF67_00220 [Thermoplasmata archaeon]|nr:hypothetical protein [Thermoplasmata archaeon]